MRAFVRVSVGLAILCIGLVAALRVELVFPPLPVVFDDDTGALASGSLWYTPPCWKLVGRWSGMGRLKTPRFTTASDLWRVRGSAFDARGDLFPMRIAVRRHDRSLVGTVPTFGKAAERPPAKSEGVLVHLYKRWTERSRSYSLAWSDGTVTGAGTFWLECDCAGLRWTVDVQEDARDAGAVARPHEAMPEPYPWHVIGRWSETGMTRTPRFEIAWPQWSVRAEARDAIGNYVAIRTVVKSSADSASDVPMYTADNSTSGMKWSEGYFDGPGLFWLECMDCEGLRVTVEVHERQGE